MEEGRRAERIHHLASDAEVISDVSETGMCFRMDRAMGSGALLAVELSSRELSMILKARVVYSKPVGKVFNIGIQFVDVSEKQKENLFDMVDSFAKGVPIRAKAVNS